MTSPLSCVLIQPAGGLLAWQRACMDVLLDGPGVALNGVLTTAEATSNTHGVTRWLDGLTRPRTARRRHFYAPAETVAQRSIPAVDRHADRLLATEDIEWIRARRPDFMLAFDVVLPLFDSDRAAPAAIWQFTEGGVLPGQPSTPALAALARGQTRLTLSFWAQTAAQKAPTLLARGHTPAVSHSRKRSLARLYEIAPDLLRRAIANLRTERGPALATPPDAVNCQSPASWPRFVAAMLRATGRRWLDKLWFRQRWDIGLLDERLPLPAAQQIATTRWLAGPETGFWADPCFLADTDTSALLVEEYSDHHGQGRITSLTWPAHAAGMAPTARPALQLDTHLSFPRSYGHAGARWLIPEMADCGEQWAYELDADGRRIDAAPVAVTGLAGVDPVLFTHAGRYWAFVSPIGRRANYQLDLYLADDFFGPYRRHPASPVRIDPHGGRSAGPVIRDGARLLRFGQVFGRHYGEAIDVFEITRLTERDYAERRIGRIRPDTPTAAGMHTIDFSATATVIDRFRLVPVWRLLLARWATRRDT